MLQQLAQKTPLHLRLTNEDWHESFRQLTRAELGVLFHIRTLDPYGDRDLDIDCAALGEFLGIHRTSVSRALEELSRKGLVALEILKARVRQKVSNKKLTLLTSPEKQSNHEHKEDIERCASAHTLEHGRTTNCVDAQPIASAHTPEHGCTDDIYIDHARAQTITDLNKTFFQESEKEKEKTICNLEEFPEAISEQEPQHITTQQQPQHVTIQQEPQHVQVEDEQHTTSVVSSPVTGFKEPFGYRKQTPMQMQWGWLPEGPWKNQEGRLETEFVVAIAKKWVNKYGGDLHEKRGDVLRHFKNDAANLAIEWDWYQGALAQKFANLHERRALGLDTTPEEREISSHEKGVAVAGAGRQASENRPPIIAPVSQDVETMDIGQSSAADYWREVHRRHSQAEPVYATPSAQELQAARGVVESLKARQQQKKSELSSMRSAEGSTLPLAPSRSAALAGALR